MSTSSGGFERTGWLLGGVMPEVDRASGMGFMAHLRVV